MKTKKTLILWLFIFIIVCFVGCNNQNKKAVKEMEKEKQKDSISVVNNPLLAKFNTPYKVPPFPEIKNHHYLPAFKKAIEIHQEEVNKIVENTKDATFGNTIQALDYSGKLLDRVTGVYYNLKSANTNDAMQKMGVEVSTMLAKHNTSIALNVELFKKVKKVFKNRIKLKLKGEDLKLLEDTYKGFVRGGANLEEINKKRYEEINQELAKLTTQYGDNTLSETNKFELIIDKKKGLAGLPDNVIAGAKARAEKKNLKDSWIFTTSKSSMIPFLTYADQRKLREKLLTAYQSRGNHNDHLDNKKILNKIINLRVEKAKLLGYKTHTHYVLEENMAKIPDHVYKLMDQVWKPALAASKKERAELQKIADKEGAKFKIQPWDWWYCTEKLRKAKYDLDDSIVKPYFTLDNVRAGAFTVINKLFGIKFMERKDIPVYHPDVSVYEVVEGDGLHIGILYFDPYSRTSKEGGAWMTSFRKQYIDNDEMIYPVISVNYNFAKGIKDTPCLLDVDQTSTLFHEMGHALHGLLSKCKYHSLSGTSVATDFVELPSQMMEHWAMHPEVLKLYAKNYKTGKVIPLELVEKIEKTKHFNQGFITVEYLSAAYLDMDYHTQTEKKDLDINDFERKSMEKIGLIPEIVVRYRSTYFTHITGGYSAGYYSYLWSEVLDCDAFEAFEENGLFDKKTADALRRYIYSTGGTVDPMVLYLKFRGKEPNIKHLLKKRGLL